MVVSRTKHSLFIYLFGGGSVVGDNKVNGNDSAIYREAVETTVLMSSLSRHEVSSSERNFIFLRQPELIRNALVVGISITRSPDDYRFATLLENRDPYKLKTPSV